MAQSPLEESAADINGLPSAEIIDLAKYRADRSARKVLVDLLRTLAELRERYYGDG